MSAISVPFLYVHTLLSCLKARRQIMNIKKSVQIMDMLAVHTCLKFTVSRKKKNKGEPKNINLLMKSDALFFCVFSNR